MNKFFGFYFSAAILAVVTVSCSGKNNSNGGENGNGIVKNEVDLNGKKYPLNTCNVIVTNIGEQSNFMVSIKSSDGNTTAMFSINTAGNELPAGTYTLFTMTPQLVVDDNGINGVYVISNPNLEVKKSGTDYEISFTAKVAVNSNSGEESDYKLTYKGKVTTI